MAKNKSKGKEELKRGCQRINRTICKERKGPGICIPKRYTMADSIWRQFSVSRERWAITLYWWSKKRYGNGQTNG